METVLVTPATADDKVIARCGVMVLVVIATRMPVIMALMIAPAVLRCNKNKKKLDARASIYETVGGSFRLQAATLNYSAVYYQEFSSNDI
jgi:hypothetical protein